MLGIYVWPTLRRLLGAMQRLHARRKLVTCLSNVMLADNLFYNVLFPQKKETVRALFCKTATAAEQQQQQQQQLRISQQWPQSRRFVDNFAACLRPFHTFACTFCRMWPAYSPYFCCWNHEPHLGALRPPRLTEAPDHFSSLVMHFVYLS